MKATTRLRKLLKEPGMLAVPGCYDSVTALISEHLGFQAVYVGGYAAEAVMLGHPDMGLKTLTETTIQAGRIADAVGLPVICDGEGGFGSYVNMVRTVKEFEKAGVAGIHVEDQVTPPCSPIVKGRRLLARDQAVGMVKAALDARTDPDFVIIARSDADEISLDELIERCNLYVEAGADIVMPIVWMINGKPWTDLPIEEVVEAHRRVRNEVSGPLLGLALPSNLTTSDIADLGYKIYIYPWEALQAASAAVYELMGELRRTGTAKGYFDRHPRLEHQLNSEMLRTVEWLELNGKYGP